MLFDNLLLGTSYSGYIAGTANGIVTVNAVAARRSVVALDAVDLSAVARTQSFIDGHWMINHLDPSKQYLVMARDYNKEYEPAVFDYVTPATDLTIQQQQELWQSWQTST